MRQRVDPDLPRLKQTTPDVRRGTTHAPAAFNLNRNYALCLPLVSDSQRIIWVHSNQIDLQDGAAELDKAFDQFPYLTEKETAALAQRCSLHPDQVRVWFMLQRLRYGISWDYKDIQEVRREMRPKQEEDGGETRQEREVDTFAGKKVVKVRAERSRNKGRMVAKNVRADKQQRKTEQDKTEKNRTVDEVEGKRNIQQKRKHATVTDKTRKKRMKKVDEGAVEAKAEANNRIKSVHHWPADGSFVVADEMLAVRPLPLPQPPPQAFNVSHVTDNLKEMIERGDVLSTISNSHGGFVGKSEMHESSSQVKIDVDSIDRSFTISAAEKLKELVKVNKPDAADGSSIVTQRKDSHAPDPCAPPPKIRCTAKTRSQLDIMKMAFSYCQYPTGEEYNQLAMVIGIKRRVLVQWFADMRYYIKSVRPRWMTAEQRSQALANISSYRTAARPQMLVKVQTVRQKPGGKMVPERNEGSGENERERASGAETISE